VDLWLTFAHWSVISRVQNRVSITVGSRRETICIFTEVTSSASNGIKGHISQRKVSTTLGVLTQSVTFFLGLAGNGLSGLGGTAFHGTNLGEFPIIPLINFVNYKAVVVMIAVFVAIATHTDPVPIPFSIRNVLTVLDTSALFVASLDVLEVRFGIFTHLGTEQTSGIKRTLLVLEDLAVGSIFGNGPGFWFVGWIDRVRLEAVVVVERIFISASHAVLCTPVDSIRPVDTGFSLETIFVTFFFCKASSGEKSFTIFTLLVICNFHKACIFSSY
jgi:hypothetical protein